MNEIRKLVFQILVIAVGAIFLIKLFFIQVLDEKYGELADSNSVLRIVEYPYRGLIFDRNGRLLVYNEPEFDIMVQVNEMSEFDSAAFCQALGIDRQQLKDRFREMVDLREYLPYKPTLFMDKLSSADIARFQDRLDEFP
ncbi:MAG: peptidoglycan glycosyltransferase, partial [Cyclobacteriaceae bacterium]